MKETESQKFIKLSTTIISLFICFILFSDTALGQDIRDSSKKNDNLWGIGASITYPLAEIYMIQVSYSPWEFGNILCGVAYQNWKNDQGRANAYTFLLGYRQFVWGGFHTEIELWPAYNPFHSSVDGGTYAGFELWMSIRIGYRYDFKLADNDFFILAQPSIGFGVAREHPWPDKQKSDKAIFEPQLIVGIRF